MASRRFLLGAIIIMRNALSDFVSICSAEALSSIIDLIADPQVSATELQRPYVKADGLTETLPAESLHHSGAAIPASNPADR